MSPPGKEQRPGCESEALDDCWAAVTGNDTGDDRLAWPATRQLKVVIESAQEAYVSGEAARELLTMLRGRSPIWSSLEDAWLTTEETAHDLVAVATRRGYVVETLTTVHADPGRGSW